MCTISSTRVLQQSEPTFVRLNNKLVILLFGPLYKIARSRLFFHSSPGSPFSSHVRRQLRTQLELLLQRPMEHYSFWLVNTLLVYLTFNDALCNPFDKENLTSSNRRSDYDDYSWSKLPSRPAFFHSWRNEYRGRKMWTHDRPEPPRSPFHPEELPIGLRTPFLGFRESVFEKVIVPHLRGNSIPSRQKIYRNFEQNSLFRHEVEESNFKLPKSYFAENPLASEIDLQHELEKPNEKSYSFDKLFRLGTGNLRPSNSKTPSNQHVFNP